MIRYAAAAEVPWRNGAGRTRELHAGDGWRLSVATIAEPAEFSAFPGLDRTLVVGRGRLDLVLGQRRQQLTEGEQVDFPGEVPVVGGPVGGPVVAVNLMTERTRWAPVVQVVRLDGAAPAAHAVVLLAGAAAVDGAELEPFDAVLGGGTAAVRADDALLVVVSLG